MFDCLNAVAVPNNFANMRGSIQYAVARGAIEAEWQTTETRLALEYGQLCKGNTAFAKNHPYRTYLFNPKQEYLSKKRSVIGALDGEVVNDGQRLVVVFGDGSKAKF